MAASRRCSSLALGSTRELSGPENVYLNGALLGMRRAQIQERFDAIELAELEDFIDAPLRTYSTGMAARLGFAIATECEPHVLLLDEVLSVGDEAFQDKRVERLREFTNRGTTMIVVTHNPDFVLDECTRAVWVHEKRVVRDSSPASVLAAYHELLHGANEPQRGRSPDRQVSVERGTARVASRASGCVEGGGVQAATA
jgi:lipopolysaccharide transport system ATP-binding protein